MLNRHMNRLLMSILAVCAISACGKTDVQSPVKDEPSASAQAPNDNAPAAAATNPSATLAPAPAPVADTTPPVITIGWSYYTSWSLFDAAEDFGLVNGEKGELGSLEKKYNVDIVLHREDYVPSLTSYSVGTTDAVFVTNTDILGFAETRKNKVGDATVAATETSHSFGADQIIVTNDIKDWAGLKGVPVKGAEFSVTEYLFWRACQVNKADITQYKFENLDPGVGAPQFAAHTKGLKAFGGWSPETFTVLDSRKTDMHSIFNSSMLARYEITDLFVIGQKALDRGGDRAVKVVAEALTEMNKKIADPATSDAAFKAFSKRFSDREKPDMQRALQLTPVASPTRDTSVLNKPEFKATMPLIAQFVAFYKQSEKDVPYAWGTKTESPTSTLRFDTSYLP